MAEKNDITRLRKLSQQYAYTSIRMHESIGKKTGLAGTDHKYLGFLLQKGKMTAGELSKLTGLTTGAVTGLIDRFESKKLVKREADMQDRRKIFIVPDIERITRLITPLYKDFQDNTDKLFSTFSSKELATLERYFSEALVIMNGKIEQINSV